MTMLLRKRSSPTIIAIAIWLIDCFIWTPICFNYIDKTINTWFSAYDSYWWSGLSMFIGTIIGELFLPILLYIFVARKYFQNRVVNTRSPNRYYSWVLMVFLIGTYFFFVPNYTYEYDLSNHLILGATFMGVGLCEEYAYRGVITRAFKEWFGVIPAVILGAILFSSSHWAELIVQSRQQFLSPNWLSGMAGNLLFGLVFGIVVWRSGSILWAAYLHFMNDWQSWTYGNPNWAMSFHIPWLGSDLGILVIGLMGAEILRLVMLRDGQAKQDPQRTV